MAIALIIIIAAVSAFACLFANSYRACFRMAVAGSAVVFALSLAVAAGYLSLGTYAISYFHVGGLARMLIALVGFVQFAAVLASGRYMETEIGEKIVTFTQAKWYYALIPVFVLSMVLAIAADGLGLMWIAVEGTTLATTMLVAFYTKEGSLEAAWKYILVCSVGIGIGLVGVLLFYYSALSSGLDSETFSVTWTGLNAIASTLPPAMVKLAFVFFFIGFGAKVGLVPMHTWLPDAHSRTPSPVSGMLSGVLLPVALYAVIRAKNLVDAVLGSSDWSNHFFIIFGALSVLVSALFMIKQTNYKRLLAYSSIEHMGLAVFALGLGNVGLTIACVHIFGHAIAKSGLFFGTGSILNAYASTKFKNVSAVAKFLPVTGTLFALGILMLLAVPPSPLFFSEVALISAAVGTHPVATAVVSLALVIVGVSFFASFMPMLFVKRDDALPAHAHGEKWGAGHAGIAVGLLALAAVGVVFAVGAGWPLVSKIISAA